MVSIISGGSKGGREGRTPPPPRRPNSFNFMQFLGEFGKIVCSRPPPLGGFTPPPRGNPGSVTDYNVIQRERETDRQTDRQRYRETERDRKAFIANSIMLNCFYLNSVSSPN